VFELGSGARASVKIEKVLVCCLGWRPGKHKKVFVLCVCGRKRKEEEEGEKEEGGK